jgi:hypothetical protein
MAGPCPLEHTIEIKGKKITFNNSTEFKTWLAEGGLEELKDVIDIQKYTEKAKETAGAEEKAAGATIPPTGGETPTEGAEAPKKATTGIKKKIVENETGWNHDINRLKVTHPETVKEAERLIKSKEFNPRAEAEIYANDPTRTANIVTQAALMIDRVKLMNERKSLNEQIKKAEAAGDSESAKALRNELGKVDQAWENNSNAVLNIGTALGQSFGFRRRIMAEDYTLEAQEMQWRKDNPGEKPSADMQEKWMAREKEFTEALDKIEKLNQEAQKAAGEEAVKNYIEAIKREKEKKKNETDTKKFTKKAKQIADKVRQLKNKPFELKDENGNVINITTSGFTWNDLVESTAKSIEGIGEAIDSSVLKTKILEALKDAKYDSISDKTKDAIAKQLAEKFLTAEPEKFRIPSNRVKEIIESGVTDIEEVTQILLDEYIDEFPDLTHREVRDAITGYGKTINMSMEDIDIQVRETKRIGRLISGIEDAMKGIFPKKSGLQRDVTTPEVRQKMKQLRNLMKDIPVEAAEVEKRYKSHLQSIKTRLENEIEDLNRQINEGRDKANKKGIEYDEDASLLAQQRNQLRAELDRKFPKEPPTDAERTEQLLTILNTHLTKLEKETERAKLGIFTKAEKKSLPDDYRTKAKRDEIKAKKEELKKLKDEAGVTAQMEIDAYMKALDKRKAKLQEKIDNKDFVVKPKKVYDFTEDQQRAIGEYENLKDKYREEKERDRLAKRGLSEKLTDAAFEVINLPKALKASFDLSAPFRQGIFLLGRHPIMFTKNFGKMVKFAGSEKQYKDWMTVLKGSPAWREIKDAGLFIADNNVKLSAGEDQFISSIPKRIPLYKELYKGSERAYAGFLNKMRVDVFTQFHDNLISSGKFTEQQIKTELKNYATFLNSATGRGHLGKFEGAANLLNGVFFSPRFVKSRIDLIFIILNFKLKGQARVEALKTAGAFIGMGVTVMTIAKLAGADVGLDPTSADFGKIIIGKKRYDVWGGESDMVRFFTQFALGKMTNPKTGKVTELNKGGFMDKTRMSLVLNFGRGKLAPTPAMLADWMIGKTYSGDPFSFSDEAEQLAIPLYINDLWTAYTQEGLTGAAAIGIPSFVGIGTKYQVDRPKPLKTKKSPFLNEFRSGFKSGFGKGKFGAGF